MIEHKLCPPGDGGEYVQEFNTHIDIIKERFERTGADWIQERLKQAKDLQIRIYVSYCMQHCTDL